MNKDSQSFSPSKTTPPIQIELDEFQISEETFKPMTKGLGFHHDTKRPSFKPAPKEVKSFGTPKISINTALSSFPTTTAAKTNTAGNHLPSGLEASGTTKPAEETSNLFDRKLDQTNAQGKSDLKKEKKTQKLASQTEQFLAWAIDVSVIASFVALTGALLVFASGIEFNMYSRLISTQDLALFTAAIFSIYYILYFTILELSSTPGKTIFSIQLARVDGGEITLKHTFARAIISLLSGIALFLPMLLDFQGRLSDTKVVK